MEWYEYVTDFPAALSEKKTSNISNYLFTVPNMTEIIE